MASKSAFLKHSALSLALLGATPVAAQTARPLVAPYSAAAGYGTSPLRACPAFPAPVRDLNLGYTYDRADETRSTYDPVARAAYEAQVKPLRDFEAQISAVANAYYQSRQADAGHCAMAQFAAWARAGALMGPANRSGEFQRQWLLGTLASHYWQLRDFRGADSATRRLIDDWINGIATAVIVQHKTNPQLGSNNNNLGYSAAWGVAMAGVATGRRDLYQWGVDKIARALQSDLQPDGTLPEELKRGKKAAEYHNFAMAPLMLVMETAAMNGTDLYAVGGEKFHRLAANIFREIAAPRFFAEKTRVPQDPLAQVWKGHFAWMRIYARRFPAQARAMGMDQFVRTLPDVPNPRMGGRMGLLISPL
ncbi:MAG: alginate lyase family protein [Alphaproteobacteria bacterium]|nr:alginate lyase family protein [Alphaproteobacteria bacterium]